MSMVARFRNVNQKYGSFVELCQMQNQVPKALSTNAIKSYLVLPNDSDC